MSKIAAVILAGGGGVRLGGVIKANLEINGVSLIARAEAALANQATPIVVSCGHFKPGQINASPDLMQIVDAEGPSAGPVSGLAAAAEWCETHVPSATFLLSMAVDTPFFPEDFVTRAEALMTTGIDVVIGASGGQHYPTNALWRLSALGGLSAEVSMGNASHGLKSIITKSATQVLDFPDDVFFNVNTKTQLEAAARRANLTPS